MSQAFGRRCAATAVLREVHGELRRHARRHREHPAKGRHCGVTMTGHVRHRVDGPDGHLVLGQRVGARRPRARRTQVAGGGQGGSS